MQKRIKIVVGAPEEVEKEVNDIFAKHQNVQIVNDETLVVNNSILKSMTILYL